MRPRSYRVKVAFWSCLATGIVLIIFMASVAMNVKGEFAELVDHDMEAIALALMTNASSRTFSENPFNDILNFDSGSYKGEIYETSDNMKEAERNIVLIALQDADGSYLFRNENYWKEEYLHSFNDTASIEVGQFLSDHDYEIALKDPDADLDNRWEIRLYKKDGRQVFLAINQHENKDEYLELILLFALELPLALLATAILGWLLGTYTLFPINSMRETISGVNADNLRKRVSIANRNDEIGDLAVQINSMLERVESGYVQAKQFTADASHELRTPLAIIQGELELNLQSDQKNAESAVRMLEEIRRLKSLTHSLLFLSKADSDILEPEFTPLNLSELLQQAFQDIQDLPNHFELSYNITIDLSEPIQINGDNALILQSLYNLLKNASSYNVPHGRVDCTLKKESHIGRIIIGNSGPEINKEDCIRIFDRFFRAHNQGDNRPGGFGLGLNITQAIINAHHGSLSLLRSQDNWTEFEIQLPLLGR